MTYCLDFETLPIDGSIIMHPPKPIGLAVKHNDGEAYYVTGVEEMTDVLAMAWDSGEELLFHNAPFDLSVARTHLGFHWPHWKRIHDTAHSAYLVDPHSRSLALKNLAQRWCNYHPDGRDELRDWILDNVTGARESSWGRWIFLAPEELVRKYAGQDVDMTWKLHNTLLGKYRPEPYDLDRELGPYLIEATRHGIRLDEARLRADTKKVQHAIVGCEIKLRELLNQPVSFNINSSKQLADALDGISAVDEWILTEKGARSTAKDNLAVCVKDKKVLKYLIYHSSMSTCLGTFMKGWLRRAEKGRLHPHWNLFKTTHGKGKGTRTGRLSSDNPNFQNVPKAFSIEVPDGFMPLPNMREYLLPDEGHVWISRDFDGQEMRTLAHFEEGVLFNAFRADPKMDPHEMVMNLVKLSTGIECTRAEIKATGFGILYGMGAPGLAKRLDTSVEKARSLIKAYLTALPDVDRLQQETKRRGHAQEPINTFGGRQYLAEKPRMVENEKTGEMELRSFEYKLLNYLNQGSAADQTKLCLLSWFKAKGSDVQFMTTVHDEINISAPAHETQYHSMILAAHMEKDLFDVPMRTTPSIGTTWGNIK